MSEAERFPVDFEALNPGDVIEVRKLEEITMKRHGSSEYQHAIRRLAAWIEKERKGISRPVVVKQWRGSLLICEASKALIYAQRRYAESGRKLRRTLDVCNAVPVAQLDDDGRKDLERLQLNAGTRLAVYRKRGPIRLAETTKADDMAGVRARLTSGKKRKPPEEVEQPAEETNVAQQSPLDNRAITTQP